MCAVAQYYDISSKADRGDIFIVHDQKSSNRTALHAMYFRCYHNYMIEENTNYKVMFYFLSPNVLFYFLLIFCLHEGFLFPQKFSVVYPVIK